MMYTIDDANGSAMLLCLAYSRSSANGICIAKVWQLSYTTFEIDFVGEVVLILLNTDPAGESRRFELMFVRVRPKRLCGK